MHYAARAGMAKITTSIPLPLLVLNYSLDTTRTNLSISELAKFTNSFIYDEQYYLYLVKPAA